MKGARKPRLEAMIGTTTEIMKGIMTETTEHTIGITTTGPLTGTLARGDMIGTMIEGRINTAGKTIGGITADMREPKTIETSIGTTIDSKTQTETGTSLAK